jgi:hypothetical protein
MARIEKGKSRNNGSDPRCGSNNWPIGPIRPHKPLTRPLLGMPISHDLHPKVAHRTVKLSTSLQIFTAMQIECLKDLNMSETKMRIRPVRAEEENFNTDR